VTQWSFTEHPATVGESYTEHLGTAFGFGFRMILGGIACVIHGILPFAFLTTGSSTVKKLHDGMVQHRVRPPQAQVDRRKLVNE
jgi:hypothetical protein